MAAKKQKERPTLVSIRVEKKYVEMARENKARTRLPVKAFVELAIEEKANREKSAAG